MKAGIKRTAAIAGKELWHILHDPRSLVIIFMLPVIQLVMFGYALNFEIQNVDLAVINYDTSHFSTELIDEFSGSRFFTVFFPDILPQEAEKLFLERKARAVLIIPSDFGRQLERRKDVALQLLIDSADPNAAQHIRNYVFTVVQQFNTNHNRRVRLPFDVRSTIWFNPELKSAYFFVPGILALILVMISALLTSVAVAREKETGTLEQLLVSPVNQYEIVLGKVLPYIGLAFLDALVILLIGIFLFDVPFRGSMVVLLSITLLYIITALSLGIMISTIAPTQQVAMMMAQSSTLLPTLFLSGFIFPLESLPKALQYISYIVPARYYLPVVRGVILKGNTFGDLVVPVAFLGGLAVILLVIAMKRFKMGLE